MTTEPEPKRVFIDMEDAGRRTKYKAVAEKIMDAVRELETPAEGYMVLKLVMESLAIHYGIIDTFMLKNETEMKQ